MNDQKVQLTLALVNGVIQYLGTRPYAEVFPLIAALQEQASASVNAAAEQPASED